jgi:hypothetical protein
VVNKKTPADSGSGVDFDASQEATNMGEKTGHKSKFMLIEKMSQAMKPQGM